MNEFSACHNCSLRIRADASGKLSLHKNVLSFSIAKYTWFNCLPEEL